MKALRYISICAAALVGLAVLAAGIALLALDPNRYRADVIRIVHEKTGRTLAIDGQIGLTFFPRIGVAVDKLALSGPGGVGEFARIGQAKLAVALLPLLTAKIVADHVDLSDVDIELVKRKDGTTNFDDLAGRDGPRAPAKGSGQTAELVEPLALEIDEIRVSNANLVWRDEADGRSVRLAGFDASIGHIAEAASGRFEIEARVECSKPELKVDLKGSGGYRLDLAKGAFALDAVDLRFAGDAPGAVGLVATVKGDLEVDPARALVDFARLAIVATSKDGLDLAASVPKLRLAPSGAAGDAASAEVKLVRPLGTLMAKLALSRLAAQGKQIRFDKLGVDAELKQGETNFIARFASPVTIDFAAKTAELLSLAGELVASGPQVPNKSVTGSVSGSAGVAWGNPSGASADLTAKLQDSNLKLKLAVENLDKPAIQFDLTGDRLDLLRYFPPVAGKSGSASAGGSKGSVAAPLGHVQMGASEKAIDLSVLKNLHANGSVRIGTLLAGDFKAQNIHIGVRAAGGRIDLSPFNASLYQGTLAGSASVNANTNQFSLREQFTAVAIGPLLRDVAGFNKLEGRGDVALNLTTTATTVSGWKRTLDGSVRIDIRDGAVKGVNLGEIVKAAGSLLGAKSRGEGGAKSTDQTEFSELSGSFAIRHGVAHNDDLAGRSPLLKLAGAGSIDLGAERIDYLVKATPVGALSIGGGRTLTVLQGVAVPVRIAGPLAAPEYSVDMAQLVVEAAKSGVKFSLGGAIGVSEGAVPLVKDLMHGLRRKQ